MKFIVDNVLIKEVVEPIVIILLSIIFYNVLKKVINNIFKVTSKRIHNKKHNTLNNFFLNIIRYIIIIIAILMILEVYGIDTKAILTSIGVFTVVVGLAFQDMIKDFLSGIALVLDDTYNIGDYVTIQDFTGEVISFGMKTTRLKAFNGDVLIINNGSMTQVINHSVNNSMAIVDIAVSYNTNLEECEKVLTDFCQKIPSELPMLNGKVQVLGVEELADSSIIFRIAAEVKPNTKYNAQRILRKKIKQELDKHHIEIPFPQVVVHNE